ncbi:MAG: thioesterase family protein [Gammaproteobacteria bacterium]|nr:thioesterase family protein [Gammaproteobacteria bacterium]
MNVAPDSQHAPFTRLVALEQTAPGHFRAPAGPERSGRLYGGQFLAQSLAAAQVDMPDDRLVHSLHAYFLRPGDVDAEVDLQVEVVRDGRGFSSRCVHALQSGKELFRMMVSFQVPEPGEHFSGAPMPSAPPPEQVTQTYHAVSLAQGDPGDWDGGARPMEILYINPPKAPPGTPVLEAQRMWMRISESLPERPAVHYAGLAYLADSTLVDHVVLPHGRRWHDPRLNGASLDHAMWFYRVPRVDQWLLYDQCVEATAGSRGLAMGRFFDRDGNLVATCMQEGLVRWQD